MNEYTVTPSECELLQRWRRQVQPRRNATRHLRRLAAVGCLTHGPILDGLVELQNLLVVVLYDQLSARSQLTSKLVGYAGGLVDSGVELGGLEHARFLKDLRLQPREFARGQRISLRSRSMLRLGLELDRELERHRRDRSLRVWPSIRIPSLWAGFHKAVQPQLIPSGPELEHMCQRTGCSMQSAVDRVRREHFGLLLYPLEWVSNHLPLAVTIFADLSTWSHGHVFQLHNPTTGLVGYRGAVHFDFVSNPFCRTSQRAIVPQPTSVSCHLVNLPVPSNL